MATLSFCLKSVYPALTIVIVASAITLGTAGAAVPAPAPVVPYTTAHGQIRSTAQFKGHPTLLWLVSTWCSSCAAGLHTLTRHATELDETGLRVVILRNYKNDGYPGPDIRQFTAQTVPQFKVPKSWTLGQASKRLDRAYNPRHYPDIYFFIDAKGRIESVGGAPAATMDEILRFARGGR